jgi:hypothetical protein
MKYRFHGWHKHVTYTVISDATTHNNATFYTFLTRYNVRRKEEAANITVIHYFSDRVASHYKNKKSVSQCHNELQI